MARGRKAIPADLKDNDTYKDIGAIERQQALTPKLGRAKLAVPHQLTDGAKKEWRRVVRLYRQLDVEILNDLDIAVFTSYCAEVDMRDRIYAAWIAEDCKLITEQKSTSTAVKATASGTPLENRAGQSVKQIVSPLLREYNRHAQTVRILAEQLGLTPTGRAAYAVRLEKAGKSPVEEFMGD